MIDGKRIQLEKISEKHTSLIVKWRNNPKVRNNFIYQKNFTEETHNEWLENKVKTEEVVQFIIYEKESGNAIGSVYLRDIDRINEKAEFGIFIGEDLYRGKGYGTEATAMMCKFAFEELSLHKIMLRVFDFNGAAIAAYERAGFLKEAYLKDDVKINGSFRNIILMAKIKDA